MKSDFIKTINAYKRYQDTLDKLADLGIDMWDNGFNDPTDYVFEAYLEEILNDEGQDLVYWWLFEDVEKVFRDDEDKVIANVESIEDFYNYLKENGYFTKD